jgi:hypothetical protein
VPAYFEAIAKTSTAKGMIQKYRFTIANHHRMGAAGILREVNRVELIEGEIIDMARAESTQLVSAMD